MRLAWFSPRPPVRSGVATYTAEIVPRLTGEYVIDCYVDRTESLKSEVGSLNVSDTSLETVHVPQSRSQGLVDGPVYDAHDFVWRHRRDPYDLVIYQLGNAPCHDYMWAYLARYPGLVVLHDARLHHARARCLLSRGRRDDYRAEFRYDHPDVAPDIAEYAVEGLGGPVSYFWPMLRVVMRTARMIAVHNARVASDLVADYPDVSIATIRMGVPSLDFAQGLGTDTRSRVRRALAIPDDSLTFAAFGKITAEKRIDQVLRAFGRLVSEGVDAHLLLIGDVADDPTLSQKVTRENVDGRVRVTGYVADEHIGDYLASTDVCLCLRWPTAHETSASWLRCLAAAKATVITDLAHLVDILTVDPRSWQTVGRNGRPPVAVAIDLLDEDRSLVLAMRRLATDVRLRDEIGRAGYAYWSREHTLDVMVDDYRRVIKAAVARSAPAVTDLPAHFTNDYTDTARQIARKFGVDLDMLR